MLNLVLFKDLSRLIETMRVIKDWFKGTDGSRVISDK